MKNHSHDSRCVGRWCIRKRKAKPIIKLLRDADDSKQTDKLEADQSEKTHTMRSSSFSWFFIALRRGNLSKCYGSRLEIEKIISRTLETSKKPRNYRCVTGRIRFSPLSLCLWFGFSSLSNRKTTTTVIVRLLHGSRDFSNLVITRKALRGRKR
jgi:hypothetical protein